MPSNERFLLDSDVLISAKNLHYSPKYCGAFWDWILQAHQVGKVLSIDKVRDELQVGKQEDLLHAWSQRPELSDFFVSSKPATAQWGKLAVWATTRTPTYLQAAQDKFLDVKSADAWLIAYASTQTDVTVVTNEKAEPASKRSIKLPDAANALGVKTMTLFELLHLHAHGTFSFQM
ncbi:protein of unknown function [Burkholderia sp. OK233]|nr:protein of unknown function [Burkholderia sp. OK233]